MGIYPSEGGAIADAARLIKTYGGDASNFAFALSKLGHRVAMLTAVGDDPFGNSFLELWRAASVDVADVQLDPKHRTGLYFASFREGRHELTYYRADSAACNLSLDKVDWERLASAKVFHLSGLSQGISRNAMDASFELLDFARRRGLRISYDPNYRPAVWGDVSLARSVITYTAETYADILEVTGEEMEALGWGTAPRSVREAFRSPPELCAVKLGPRGSLLVTEAETLSLPAFPVAVKDSVGAGDAFAAGLISGLLEKLPLEEAGRLAAGAASLVCGATGPLDGQPTRAVLDSYLSSLVPA